MKTNIIHVLIIAIILIAGWSLFTILQDFYNTDTNAYRNYNVVGKSRQYLPLSPQDYYSGQKKYPVYKPSVSAVAQRVNYEGNGSLSLNAKDEGYTVNEINYDVQRGNGTGQLRQINNRTAERRNNLVSEKPSSQMIKPFSKSMNIDATRNIADASVSSSSSSTAASVSEGNSMMKVFGNDDEGDAIEGGGGTDNQNFYNDVPVGDGTLLLVLMALLYSMYITLKVSGRISFKKK